MFPCVYCSSKMDVSKYVGMLIWFYLSCERPMLYLDFLYPLLVCAVLSWRGQCTSCAIEQVLCVLGQTIKWVHSVSDWHSLLCLTKRCCHFFASLLELNGFAQKSNVAITNCVFPEDQH